LNSKRSILLKVGRKDGKIIAVGLKGEKDLTKMRIPEKELYLCTSNRTSWKG
jgi:hypothetical protein